PIACPMRPSPMNPIFMFLWSPRGGKMAEKMVSDTIFPGDDTRRKPASGKWCLTPFFPTPFSGLQQLAAHPLELARHVVDDVARLRLLGKHVPRVRLDLEVRRQLVLLVELQRVLDREARRLEVAEIVEEDRHVEVRAPLALAAGILVPRLERVAEIQEPRQLAVAPLDGLRQIHRVRVLPKRVDLLLRDLRHAHRGRLLQLEDRDTAVRERAQRRADILVLDGLMADVVDHAEVLAERRDG